MRAINLFSLTREIDRNILQKYERLLSNRDKYIQIRDEEVDIIKKNVDIFRKQKLENFVYENWFYSFTIPNISKEFDLLKVGFDNKIINIEIKSQEVDQFKIERQLCQNRYYLSHIGSEIYSFTCMLDNNCDLKIFRYDKKLKVSNIDELLECVRKIEDAVDSNIEDLFKPKDYLISPFNETEKFVKGEYYLTGQQEQIKNEIIDNITNEKMLLGIQGGAGTGKTLLLYDIAKTLSADFSVGIIHCGNLNNGHNCLNNEFKKENMNISIISAKKITDDSIYKCSDWLKHCEIICIDETQRIYESTLKFILETYDNKGTNIKGIIFSYDPKQKMSRSEIANNNLKIIEARGSKELKLLGKIRTNTGIYFFIKNMMDLKKENKTVSYTDIDIVYAEDREDFVKLRDFYVYKGYTFLAYTPASKKYDNDSNKYLKQNSYNYKSSHDVIGQEFDKIIILVDNNFFYNSKEELDGKGHPNEDYLFERLLYQNITRVKEKLCIIVLNNKDVFEKLIEIKEKNLFG
jgi:uncharacterized conserved protein (DUF2075)